MNSDMGLPPSLNDAIAQGLDQVRQRSDHHLQLGYRALIWRALGPVLDPSQPQGGSGHRRRTFVDLLAAQKVLPRWDAVWAGNTAPHEVLEEAEQVLRGKGGDDEAVNTSVMYLWTDVDDAAYDAQDSDHMLPIVLLACVKVLIRAWTDWEFTPSKYPREILDGRQGTHVTDAAYDASIVYADGLPWDTDSNPARRQEFWEWWLTSAVPNAWDMGTNPLAPM